MVLAVPPGAPGEVPEPAAIGPSLPSGFSGFSGIAAHWPFWVAGAYGLVVASLMGVWLLGHLALWRLLRDAVPAPEFVAKLFDTMAPAESRPRLLVSHRFRTPVSCGLFRPTVVLPPSLCGEDELPVLRWVFAHELAHLERRDAWSCLLLALGRAIYFYLPWYWWLRRQVRLCQEYVADAAAASAEQAADYAQFLVQLRSSPVLPACASGVSGHTSDLFRRITMLLQPSVVVEKRCPRLWSAVTAAGLLALAVVVSGFGLAAGAAPVADDTKPDKTREKPEKAEKPEKPKKEEVPKIVLPDVEKILQEVQKQLQDSGVAIDPAKMAEIQAHIQAQLKKSEKEVQKALEKANQFKLNMGKDGAPFMFKEGQPSFNFKEGPQNFNVEIQPSSRRHSLLGISVEKAGPGPRGSAQSRRRPWPGDHERASGLGRRQGRTEGPRCAARSERQGRRRRPGAEPADRGNEGRHGFQRRRAAQGQEGNDQGRDAGRSRQAPCPTSATPQGFNPFGNVDEFSPFVVANRGKGVMTMLSRTDDKFNVVFSDGGLQITMTGAIEDGKARVSSIKIKDGDEDIKATSVDKVPSKYRDQVKKLLEMSEKGNVHVEKF